MKTTYIYALIDPRTNEVKYIGKSDKPDDRLLHGHIGKVDKDKNKHKTNWIKQLLKLNLQPSLMILEECENDKAVWSEREKYWVKYYREQGCKLTNLTDGGEGANGRPISEKHREAIIRTNKNRECTEEYRIKRKELALKWWEDHPEAREKQSKIMKERGISEEQRKNQSEFMLNYYNEHPEKREQFGNLWKGKKQSEKHIENKRIALLKYHENHPEVGEEFGKKQIGTHVPESTKKAVAKANHERVWFEESKEKQRKNTAIKKRKENGQWYK